MNNTSPQPMPNPARVTDPQPATYEAPAVIFEAALEVRAGTPFGLPDPLDLFGTH